MENQIGPVVRAYSVAKLQGNMHIYNKQKLVLKAVPNNDRTEQYIL